MRSPLLSALLTCVQMLLISPAATAFEVEEERLFGPSDAATRLRVISTTDTELMAPLIEAYLAENPSQAIEYTTVSSADLMLGIYQGEQHFDLALSSAMDLQTKLSNDGYTQSHRSDATELVPEWARWGDHLFAFSQESAAIVISPAAFEGLALPETRQDLITLMRDHEDRFRGRVGTYDITTSGLGYLFATQDARTSESFWRLTEIMGNLQTTLYCCSSDMLNDLASGEIAVAYNALGSYAQARTDLADRIHTIEPRDYTLIMLRTAAILKGSENADAAGWFLDHLIHAAWGTQNTDIYPFPRYDTPQDTATHRPIRLGPGLLVYLDGLKRRGFLEEWTDAIRYTPVP